MQQAQKGTYLSRGVEHIVYPSELPVILERNCHLPERSRVGEISTNSDNQENKQGSFIEADNIQLEPISQQAIIPGRGGEQETQMKPDTRM